MSKPIWLDLTDAMAIHDKMLTQHGGLAGTRDQGLLESALAKPLNLFNYGQPSLTDLAASYASGIVHNHPFLDGNKRTGFMLAAAFLEINGHAFTASEVDVVERTLALAAGEIDEAEYGAWLKLNSHK